MAVTPLASPEWHRSAHLELRRQIMGRLRDHPILAVNPALQRDAARHGMPTLLQRLEWMLYHAAHSINEYANVDTLERRVQALVTHYTRHQPDQEATSGEDSDESSSDSSSVIQRPMTGRTRRFQSMTGDPEELRAGKRQHTLKALDSIDSDQEVELTCTDRVDGRRHSCALSHNLDLLRHVFSFLDGRESLRCRAVNRFFRVHAPSFVWTLTIESVGPAGIRCSDDAVGLADLLVNCKNIRRVMISSSINQTNIKAGVVFPRALSQATAQAPASFGRQAVLELADAVSRGGCRKLEAVHLTAPFDYANESDAVLTLIHALTTGSIDSAATGRASGSMRKRRRRASLKALVLDSTFLGDKGIVKLAKTIESVPHFFHKVEQLGLRNNFIGEGGCCAMLDAIAVTMPKLRALDLRQNILTNVDAVEIADLLDRPAPGVKCEMELDTSLPIEQLAVPRLSEIELDGNFISCDGFHAISIAMCSHGEAPAGLIRSISGEEGESDDSSRSSYAEPMEE